MEDLKRTPLYDWHKSHGAKLVPFGGYEMPLYYTSIVKEHMAVRGSVGIFDVSHMGEIFIEGHDALDFVDYLLCAKLKDIPSGKVKYSFLLKEDGGIVDDLLVYVFSPEKVMLVVNAANIDKDISYIRSFISGGLSCRVVDLGNIAIQGPDSSIILSEFVDFPLSSLKFYYFREKVRFLGREVVISHTGYTGDLGFEIYGQEEDIPFIWETLIEKGVSPCGLGARDTLRLEAGYPLYGHELSEEVNPIEAGLSGFVFWEKEFIGKDALLKAKENPQKKLIGFIAEKGVPRQGYKLFKGNNEIGWVTSGGSSPMLKKMIGLGYVRDLDIEEGDEIFIDIRGKMIPGEVVSPPFYKKNRR